MVGQWPAGRRGPYTLDTPLTTRLTTFSLTDCVSFTDTRQAC